MSPSRLYIGAKAPPTWPFNPRCRSCHLSKRSSFRSRHSTERRPPTPELGAVVGADRERRRRLRSDLFDIEQDLRSVDVRLDPDESGISSIRRRVLDGVLVDAVRSEGVRILEGTRVDRLLFDDGGRVNGVGIGNSEVRCRLVVGADGRNSLVARSVGARSYHVVQGARCSYWGYFRNVNQDVPTGSAFAGTTTPCWPARPTTTSLRSLSPLTASAATTSWPIRLWPSTA